MSLPFVTPPAPSSKRFIGNQESGVLEFEVCGGLTVGESATISELLASQQSAFVRGAQIADAIAKAESISLTEAFSICEKAISGLALEPEADRIRVQHAERIEQLAQSYAKAGQRNMEASVTALIRHRLNQPQWSMEDTHGLKRVLFQGIWQLVLDEQAAEEIASAPMTEDELGKPLRASGAQRKRTGKPSSMTSAMHSQVSSTAPALSAS